MEAINPSSDLERIFRETAEDLARYFSRRHADPEQARDLVQETFVEMARSIGKGLKPQSPRAYLFGIARQLSMAAWKRRDREQALASNFSVDQAAANSGPDDRITAAREVIAALPPLQREILELRFTQDLSYAEIAEALGIPLGTVRSRLHNAVALIRLKLAEDEIDSPEDSLP